MNTQRFGIGLTVINLFLLGLLLTQVNRPAIAAETPENGKEGLLVP